MLASKLSVSPEIIEPVRIELGVFDSVLNVFVAQVVLDSVCILPLICKLVTTGMPEHVGMHRKFQIRGTQTREQ